MAIKVLTMPINSKSTGMAMSWRQPLNLVAFTVSINQFLSLSSKFTQRRGESGIAGVVDVLLELGLGSNGESLRCGMGLVV
jgi:hypothetical protein